MMPCAFPTVRTRPRQRRVAAELHDVLIERN